MRETEKRYGVRLSTDFPAAVASNTGSQFMRVTNLSTGGVQLQRGRSAIVRGERVSIRFRLPSGSGPIHCEADVVYEDVDTLGIRFSELTEPQQKILGLYLDRALGEAWFL